MWITEIQDKDIPWFMISASQFWLIQRIRFIKDRRISIISGIDVRMRKVSIEEFRKLIDELQLGK